MLLGMYNFILPQSLSLFLSLVFGECGHYRHVTDGVDRSRSHVKREESGHLGLEIFDEGFENSVVKCICGYL